MGLRRGIKTARMIFSWVLTSLEDARRDMLEVHESIRDGQDGCGLVLVHPPQAQLVACFNHQ
jgi:hypothetical protein